jgi:hypothetical protein
MNTPGRHRRLRRDHRRPLRHAAPLGFRELGILAQIGELTGAAADRLRGHGGEPPAG